MVDRPGQQGDLPALLARGHAFWPDLLVACAVTVLGYAATVLILRTWIRPLL